MFERFTDRARRVLVLAQEEAKGLEHNFIGTEHLLLGMLHEGEGVAAKALTELGLDLETIRARVIEVITPGAPGTADDRPPFTPRSKSVLEFSLREALDLGHNYIGTEHLLLGLLREGEGVGGQLLVQAGLQEGVVRAKVVELLRGYTPKKKGKPADPATGAASVTPAGAALPAKAAELAGGAPIGSQHYLQALLADPDSVAARVLESIGVTAAAVGDRIAALGVAGTTDEMPPPDAGVLFDFRLGDGFTLRISDRALADQLRRTLTETSSEAEPGALSAQLRRVLADYLRAPTDGSTGADGGSGDAGPSGEDPSGEAAGDGGSPP